MTIPMLTELQAETITAAANLGTLVQILPNREMDKPDVYDVWTERINQTVQLIAMGLLKEMPTDKDTTINVLRTQYPGRQFRMYEPTPEAVAMFGSGTSTRKIC